MKKLNLIVGALALCLGAESFAALSEAEAARLGKDLTPIGAERAGNAAGTIPEWTGGLAQAPAGYEEGGFLVDPFPDDKPLFVITAENAEQYKSNLTPGQVAMLKKYPDYRMPVYLTRRTAAFTQEIYDDTRKHALTANLTADGNGVEGRGVGSPFPIPANGLQAIWNHTLRFRGYSM